MNEEKRYEIYMHWKTCFFCKRKGCNFCVEAGDGLTWNEEPIDFICEDCLEREFPDEVEQIGEEEEEGDEEEEQERGTNGEKQTA